MYFGLFTQGTVTSSTKIRVTNISVHKKMDTVHIKDGAVTSDTIRANAIDGDHIRSNAFEGHTFTGGTFTGALFQTVSTLFRGVKMSSTGLRAWDDTGKLTANIDGKDNLLSGVLRTSPEGEAGLIIDPQRVGTGRPAVFFSPDGVAANSTAAIYTSSDWDLILRGRSLPGGRARIVALGGIEAREGGMLVSDGYGVGSNGRGVFNGLEVAVGTSDFFSAASFKDNTTVSGILYANGRLRNSGADSTSYSSNVYMDTYGFLYKSSSASRYKLNQQVTDIDDALLDLPVKTWQDREAVETAEELSSRIGPLTEEDAAQLDAAQQAAADTMFGVIAEDVEKVDSRLVTYDKDGRVEGVAYDRFGPALIPLVRRQRDRIAALEAENKELRARLEGIEKRLGIERTP